MHHSDFIEIAAPADELYRLVAGLEHMGSWSPQNAEVHWDDGATGAVGDEFTGLNRQDGHEWSVPCKVTEAEPGVVFEWVTRPQLGGCVRWTWRFDETAGVTTVTEAWDVQRLPPPLEGLTESDYAEIVERTKVGIRTTLENLRAHVEG